MENKILADRLLNMINQPLIYREKKAVIINFKTLGDIFLINVSINGVLSQFEKTPDELDLFLLNFRRFPKLPVPGETLPSTKINNSNVSSVPAIPEPDFITKHRNIFSNLTNKLLGEIDKVQQDPQYIKQAKQVSDLSTTIIDIAKLELDTYIKLNSL